MVMRRKRLCKITLERILGIKIADVSYPDSEKTVDVDLSAKSIRLDIYCEDDKSMYNIELQNGEYEDLPRRSRYYQSLMDIHIVNSGRALSYLYAHLIFRRMMIVNISLILKMQEDIYIPLKMYV